MSFKSFLGHYVNEFGTILGVLIPLVENSNIFKSDKDDIRAVLEGLKDNVDSINKSLEDFHDPVVIKLSDIENAVARYFETHPAAQYVSADHDADWPLPQHSGTVIFDEDSEVNENAENDLTTLENSGTFHV